jgi:hypothetical protein
MYSREFAPLDVATLEFLVHRFLPQLKDRAALLVDHLDINTAYGMQPGTFRPGTMVRSTSQKI